MKSEPAFITMVRQESGVVDLFWGNRLKGQVDEVNNWSAQREREEPFS